MILAELSKCQPIEEIISTADIFDDLPSRENMACQSKMTGPYLLNPSEHQKMLTLYA